MTLLRLKSGTSMRNALEASQKKRLQKLYLDAAQESKRRLQFYANQSSATAYLQTLRLNQLSAELDRVYYNLYSNTEPELKQEMNAMSKAVLKDMSQFYSSIGLKFGVKYANVPEEVVDSIALGKVYEGNWSLSKAIWGDYNAVRNDIQTIIAKGVALNKSTLDIAKDLEQYVDPTARKPWDWGKVYPGVRTKIDYNAQRLARTMVSHAYEQSLVLAAEKNPFVQGIKWLASNSDRTCELCHERSERDGYGLGAGVFPIDELPLDHPNGMCTYSVVLIGSLQDISKRLSRWVAGEPDEKLDEYYRKGFISV